MNTITRNLLWLLFGQAATVLVSVSLLVVGPRVLGDKVLGQVSLAAAYVSFFDLTASMGINTFLVKSIARDHANVGRYLANAVVLKLTLAIIATVGALVLAIVLHMSATVQSLIFVYCLGMIFNAVGTTLAGALGGLQLMGGLTRWNIMQCYAGGIAAMIVLLNHGSVVIYVLVISLSWLIPIPANFLRLRPYINGGWSIDVRRWIEILRGGFPFFALTALLVVYGTIDVPLLQALTDSEHVGWYSVANRWVSVPALITAAIGTAFFPALSAEGRKVNEEFVSLAHRAIRMAALVATPAAVGIALVSAPFLHLLYGDEFTRSIPPLRILALQVPILSFDIILGSIATASDRQRKWLLTSIVATVFNPITGVIIIPLTERRYGNGAIGASIVTVLTELILMVGGILILPKGVLDRTMIRSLLRIMLATSAIIPVILLIRSTPLVVQVLAGVGAYATASLALGTLSIREVKAMVPGLRARIA